ncbi:uncharacterized protein METZ01_LOCUS516420, partial [marine metagenome]
MRFVLPFTCLIACLGWTCVVSGEDPQPSKVEVLKSTELADDVRAQSAVKGALGASVTDIERLLEDLKSNNLSSEGKSEVYENMKTGLNKVRGERVDEVTKNLKKARKTIDQKEDAYPPLDKADKEINEII